MIRDPSDGSVRLRQEASPDAVREKPVAGIPTAAGIPTTAGITPVIDTSTSGLPITKADYLARLEESRKWLESYVRPTITPGDNE